VSLQLLSNEVLIIIINFAMEEQIAESDLLDVFDQIKGPLAKQRAYINIDDFAAAVLKYKPASL